MNTRIILVAVAAALGLVIAAPMQASAGLVYDETILLSAQGFGTANKDLTVQDHPQDITPTAGVESGCVSWGSGGIIIGSTACQPGDAVHLGDGQTNVGGSEPPPLGDNQKYGAPLESDLGGQITADDIGILFNATEPGGDAITVEDLTLKFFLGTTLIGSIDLHGTSQTFASSQPGLGVAGFTFVIHPTEYAYVNSLLDDGNVRLTLEATLSGSSGGEETFQLVNLETAQVVPEPTTMLLFGTGLVGLAARARRSRKTGK